jgi:hypothetical protein
MPILFRYLLREYAKIFLMCFAGLMTIYLVIDFFEKVRRFLSFDATWLDVLLCTQNSRCVVPNHSTRRPDGHAADARLALAQQ